MTWRGREQHGVFDYSWGWTMVGRREANDYELDGKEDGRG
jgi:hypothetical protein